MTKSRKQKTEEKDEESTLMVKALAFLKELAIVFGAFGKFATDYKR